MLLPRAPEASGSTLGAVDADGDTAESALAGWVEAIDASFARAVLETGETGHTVRLAGAVVRLQSAGQTMLDLLATAFAHLYDETGDEPALTIRVWDSRSAGVDPPPLPSVGENEPRGAVVYSAAGPLQVAYQPGLSVLTAFDAERSIGWFWCRDAATLPFWEPAAPFRQLLHWWLAHRGLLLLHGASVGTEEGGVLLVGRGGSGKSTCALSSLASNLLYAGDDYVAVRAAPDPYVYSLYSSGKLEPTHSMLLPHLPVATFDGDASVEEKAVFYVHERFPDRTCHGFPLRAVLVPKITWTPRLRMLPIEPGAALRALAPSTLFQMRPARPEPLAMMARMLERVPTFAFEVGSDIAEIPRAIERFLRDLPA